MNNKVTVDRNKIAVSTALLFHATGLIGILWIDKARFASLTPLNMLVMFALIWLTHLRKNTAFFLFALICFATGFAAEAIGIHTGLLFGSYTYGSTLGYKLNDVPLLIGINWFMVIYCCGVVMHMLQQKIRSRLLPEDVSKYKWWSKASIIIDGALLAVFFDWVMEPVAVSLGFWQWDGGVIPTLNFVSWFAVSALLLVVFSVLRFDKTNVFAVHLLLIQFMFFLLLRTLLPS